MAIDKVLTANFALREVQNFILEWFAKVEDLVMPLDTTSGALIVYEKV